jgi:hypothetical protein
MRNTGGTSVQATAEPGISRVLTYTVVELTASGTAGPITGYLTPTKVYSGGSSTTAGIIGNITNPSVPHTAVVTNTLDVLANVTVNKVWQDAAGVFSTTNANEFAKTAPVDVRLYYRLAETIPSQWISADVTRQLTSENNWTGTFTNLPKQNSDGIAFEYTVREVKIGGVDIDENVFPLSYSSSVGVVNAMVNPAGGITVTNTLETRDNITINKIWDDNNNQDGRRPGSVTVYLIRDMDTPGERIISTPVVLNQSNNWSATFENLPKFKAHTMLQRSRFCITILRSLLSAQERRCRVLRALHRCLRVRW